MMSTEQPPTPPEISPDDDPEHGNIPPIPLDNTIEGIRTLVIRSSRSRYQKAASRADSGVALEHDGVAGPARQPDREPNVPPPAVAAEEGVVAPAPHRRRRLPVEDLLVPSEHVFAPLLEVDGERPALEDYLVPDVAMADRMSPRANSILEADPDMMNQEFLSEDLEAPGAGMVGRGAPQNGMTRAERARVLFERYGVAYEDVSDMVPGQDVRDAAQRVHARVRMRVRFNCHVCNTTFRHERACRQCSHARCDACPRVLPHRRATELRIQRRLMAERLARRSRSPDETLPDMDEADRLHGT